MKIAVTGSNGSVGRRVVIQALDDGHSVVGIDSKPFASTIDDVPVRRVSEHEAFSFVQHDLKSFDGLMNLLKDCDAVVHLAAHRNPGDYLVSTHNDNVVMSWNVLRAAVEVGIKRIAQASSVNILRGLFAKDGAMPAFFPIDESHPCEPDEPYGLSKLICEAQADALVRRYPDVRIASLRLHWSVPRREEATRDTPEKRKNDLWGYVYEDSAAEAFLLSLTSSDNKWKGHEAFFICAPRVADDAPLIELWEKFFRSVPWKTSSMNSFEGFFDCSKAERLLGWVHRDPV